MDVCGSADEKRKRFIDDPEKKIRRTHPRLQTSLSPSSIIPYTSVFVTDKQHTTTTTTTATTTTTNVLVCLAYRIMTILVTGSAGHLGEGILRLLRDEQGRSDVVGVDIRPSP
jgi:hypothetical protein